MKQIAVVLLFIIFSNNISAQSASDFKKLNWLEGKWMKTNVKPGRSGYEEWQRVSATSWKGTGISMRGQDTTFVEKLQLRIKDNYIYYVADVAENKELTWFKITHIGANGFTCEDPAHDFPKKIVYERTGKQLKVTTSGDGKSIEFLFEKE
ncbi:DUF6265 family protein [Chitinophaga sp. Cy-1792]|uniref:DUF6265 family protein n=1 Tax=Chitinophaga sp. Cy-1792 TaxID=2608339 RepID=UPI001420F227|nr:DUF6265 family protein [Chitinophaga sp. Cy-1792]NIG55766.1 hypothetical protein [Chitinophaga sp. Cy-1792]